MKRHVSTGHKHESSTGDTYLVSSTYAGATRTWARWSRAICAGKLCDLSSTPQPSRGYPSGTCISATTVYLPDLTRSVTSPVASSARKSPPLLSQSSQKS